MKFYLHWLRHDLRRFRWPLTLWCAGIAAYAVFLAWLHARILTVEPDTISWTGPATTVLMLGAFQLAIHMLSTDPAGGSRVFWKTRPPAGFSIAAVKLTLVTGFLVVLPMLAWLAVRQAFILPGYARIEPGELSLTARLWWGLAMLVSACVLAAAPASGSGSTFIRMGQLSILCFALYLFSEMNTIFTEYPAWQWAEAGRLFRGLRHPAIAAAALALGGGFFLAARRGRSPRRGLALASFLSPLLLTGLGILTFRPVPTRNPDESFSPLSAERVASFQTEPVPPCWLQMERAGGGRVDVSRPYDRVGIYRIPLQITGLPPRGVVAQGRWLDLRIIAPDGRSLAADSGVFPQWEDKLDDSWQNQGRVLGCIAVFPEKELRAFSLQPCRAEGRLRLTLHQKQETSLALDETGTVENALGRFRFRHVPGDEEVVTSMGGLAVPRPRSLAMILRQPAPAMEFSIKPKIESVNASLSPDWNDIHSRHLEYTLIHLDYGLISNKWEKRRVPMPNTAASEPAPQLSIDWFTSEGTTDISLSIPVLLVPALQGDDRKASALLAALELPADLSPEEALLRLKLATQFLQQPDANTGSDDEDAPARLAAWESLLGKATRAQLPALLDLCEENAAAPASFGAETWETALRRRTAQLLEGGDLEAIRARPALARYLGEFLPDRTPPANTDTPSAPPQ